MSNRREFIVNFSVGSAALVTTQAQAQALVDEKDPQAAALGYVADTKKADKKKYAAHNDSQTCKNCGLYQAKDSDPAGACGLFAGKKVAAAAWCAAWVKKA